MIKPRCLIYCRVSSEKQATEEKTSLAMQEEHCRKAAKERGYDVVGVYRDVIPRSLLERPQLNEARAKIAAGEAEVLMASVIDRLGSNESHIYILMEEAERKGARIEFALEEYDDTPMGTLLRSVRTFMAAVELEKLSFRVQQGVKAKIMAGEAMGTIPTGYQKQEDGLIVVNPLTAPTVRYIFELYAGGESLYGIKAILESEGHLTLRNKPKWSTSAIANILTNEKYIGRWQDGRTGQKHEKGKRPKTYLKPKEEWGPLVEGPAIVTEELFNKANKRRLTAKAESPRWANNPDMFLLRAGHIRCGECGGTMHGVTSRKGRDRQTRHYYQCSAAGCRKANISVKLIDEPVWEICREVMDDPDLLAKQADKQAGDGSLDRQRSEAQAEIEAVQAAIERLIPRVALVPDSAVPGIRALFQTYDLRLAAAHQKLAELENQAEAQAQVQATVLRFMDWQKAEWERIDKLTINEKRAILKDLGITTIVYDFGHKPRWTVHMRIAPYDDYQWTEDDWWQVDPEGYAEWQERHGLAGELVPGDPDAEVSSVQKTCALLSATPRA